MKLSGARAVLAVEGQHPLIALGNAAARLLAANLSAAGDAWEPWTRKGGCHGPQPHPTSRAALDLVNGPDVRIPEAVAPPTGLVFIKAGPIALKPVAARPSL